MWYLSLPAGIDSIPAVFLSCAPIPSISLLFHSTPVDDETVGTFHRLPAQVHSICSGGRFHPSPTPAICRRRQQFLWVHPPNRRAERSEGFRRGLPGSELPIDRPNLQPRQRWRVAWAPPEWFANARARPCAVRGGEAFEGQANPLRRD